MPNYCENQLYVSGDPDGLEQFEQVVKVAGEGERTRSIASLIPQPAILDNTVSPTRTDADLERLKEKHQAGTLDDATYVRMRDSLQEEVWANHRAKTETGFANWYDWRDAYWGTKWGDYDYFKEPDDGPNTLLEYGFYTAWTPFSVQFMRRISLLFPSLYFTLAYLEEGMGFMGAVTVHNGEVIDIDHEDCDVSIEESADEEDEYIRREEAVRDKLSDLVERHLGLHLSLENR